MALVPFPGAAKPAPEDDDQHIRLTDPDVFEDSGAKMSFLDHLDELRKRLIACVWGLVVGCAIGFIFVQRIQNFIWLPLYRDLSASHGVKFMFTTGFEPFMLTMKIGALTGLFIALPFVIWQLWLFIAPGLYSHEKRMAVPFVVFCTLFFVLGAAFSHYAAFPWTWKFFLGWQTEYMEFRPSIDEVFGLYVKMMLGFGLIFQMPTVVYFLARMGVVSARFLLRNAKYAVLVIFIVAAVVSPGTDVVSQCLMAFPMLALYGVSIFVAWAFAKPRSAE
jgi:sec-independent protein translocase protein TatC